MTNQFPDGHSPEGLPAKKPRISLSRSVCPSPVRCLPERAVVTGLRGHAEICKFPERAGGGCEAKRHDGLETGGDTASSAGRSLNAQHCGIEQLPFARVQRPGAMETKPPASLSGVAMSGGHPVETTGRGGGDRIHSFQHSLSAGGAGGAKRLPCHKIGRDFQRLRCEWRAGAHISYRRSPGGSRENRQGTGHKSGAAADKQVPRGGRNQESRNFKNLAPLSAPDPLQTQIQ